MPRFYFHIRDDIGVFRDDVGLEITGEIEAREEARASAVDIVSDGMPHGKTIAQRVMEVQDERGVTVSELPVMQVIRSDGSIIH